LEMQVPIRSAVSVEFVPRNPLESSVNHPVTALHH
jgi:hypothetical protein